MKILRETSPYIQSFDDIMRTLAQDESVDISKKQEDDILQFLQDLFLQDKIRDSFLQNIFHNNNFSKPTATPLARFQLRHQSITSSQCKSW